MLKVFVVTWPPGCGMCSLSEEFAEEEHSEALLVLTNQFSDNHNVVGGRRGCDRHACHVDKHAIGRVPRTEIGNDAHLLGLLLKP